MPEEDDEYVDLGLGLGGIDNRPLPDIGDGGGSGSGSGTGTGDGSGSGSGSGDSDYEDLGLGLGGIEEVGEGIGSGGGTGSGTGEGSGEGRSEAPGVKKQVAAISDNEWSDLFPYTKLTPAQKAKLAPHINYIRRIRG